MSNDLKLKKIHIDSSKLSVPEHYGKYIVNMEETFDGPLKRIKNINIYKYNIPTNIKINETCDKLNITYQENKLELEITNKQYTIEELIIKIDTGLKKNLNDNTKVELIDNNKVKISSDDILTLENEESSILRVFGFTQNNYSGEKSYISEKKHIFNIDNLYLYITNISENPFAVINQHGKMEQLITQFDKPLQKLSTLNLQFKNSETEDDDIHNFAGSPHILDIQFEVY